MRRPAFVLGWLLVCALPSLGHAERLISIETASWYGAWHQGKPMANGRPFNMRALTAAHKTLPLGTRLRITSIDTGRSVDVTVTDRGPYIKGRDLDLSRGAAEAIGMVQAGVGRVWIEEIPPAPPQEVRTAHAAAH